MSVLVFISYTQWKSGECDALWLPHSALHCSCASLEISSKQQVLQSTVKNPAVFKGRNSVRKTSKQVTLLGIELNIPEAASALRNLSFQGWERELSPAWHWPSPVHQYLVASVLSGRCVHLTHVQMHTARCSHHSPPPRTSPQTDSTETLKSILSTDKALVAPKCQTNSTLTTPLYSRIQISLPAMIPDAQDWLSPHTGQRIVWKTDFFKKNSSFYYYSAADSRKLPTHSSAASLAMKLR